MSHLLWTASLLLALFVRAAPDNVFYLTFNQNVSAMATQHIFDGIYKGGVGGLPSNIRFESLGTHGQPASPSGIFGAQSYFVNLRDLSSPIFNGSCTAKDIYVSTMDLNAADLLKACIKLLERMREETHSSASEKTVLAIPKYMTDISNPYVLLPFISIAQTLTTRILIFWYQDANDADILTSKINEGDANNVVLLLPVAHLNDVIKSAYEKNLFTWSRRWVIMSLDGALPSLPRGKQVRNENISVIHVGSGTVPGMSIFDGLAHKLAHDTAHVAKAYIEGRCVGVRKDTTVEGFTGRFKVGNLTARRESINLTITRGLTQPPEVAGTIAITGANISIAGSFNKLFNFSDDEMRDILTSRNIRLAVALTPPFAMLDEKASGALDQPRACDINRLSGLSVDIVRGILDPLHVTYECTCYPSSLRKDSLHRVSSGLADMAVGEFAVLPQLRDDFDFISNFLYFTFSILEKPLADKETTFLWLFFKPLSAGTWVMVLFCCLVAALVLATLNYFSPNQGDYGFIESIFVTFGCLFQGLTVSPPNTWSSRFMQCVWWLFVLLFIVIYIANYAAIIMNNGIRNEASGFTALLVDPSTPFGAIPNSMAVTQMDYAQEVEIQKVNYLSNKLYPQDENKGVTIEERVKEVSEGKYKLISDSFSLEYFAANHCLVVSGEFSSQQYAIILKKGAVYTTFLNSLLTNLTNRGNVKVIIDKYIKTPSANSCPMPIKQESNEGGVRYSIDLKQIGGIFILMLIGIVVAIVLAIVEALFARKLAVSTLVPLARPPVRLPSFLPFLRLSVRPFGLRAVGMSAPKAVAFIVVECETLSCLSG